MTKPKNISLGVLANEISEAIVYQTGLVTTRERLSAQYAHEALVKYHAFPSQDAREAELKAMKSAFWHDGSADGARSAVHSLVNIQKRLCELQEANE